MFFKTFIYGYVTVLISDNEIFILTLSLPTFLCLFDIFENDDNNT